MMDMPCGEYVVKCPAGEREEKAFCVVELDAGACGTAGLIICRSCVAGIAL
jgi:hypothetical protein